MRKNKKSEWKKAEAVVHEMVFDRKTKKFRLSKRKKTFEYKQEGKIVTLRYSFQGGKLKK